MDDTENNFLIIFSADFIKNGRLKKKIPLVALYNVGHFYRQSIRLLNTIYRKSKVPHLNRYTFNTTYTDFIRLTCTKQRIFYTESYCWFMRVSARTISRRRCSMSDHAQSPFLEPPIHKCHFIVSKLKIYLFCQK